MAQTEAPQAPLTNDVRDGGWRDGEWKPRPRTNVIGGIEWLARMSDKARAKAKGTIGDYIYPCPADKRLLGALEVDPETFLDLATKASSDDELVAGVKEVSPTLKAGTFNFTINRPKE
ncbi:MAG: hypothetical protein AVDCRST_MAG77-5622 [uncultured Chloroflexi bacterium]|uniref:DUF5069 domain-containing protein n=1 Tax=uncultured Chloroflexota bacterium TaxID=166587 RepID=A0A6J4K650_9CHLR|nr:MAG: hypothetical protein AVDCRST_MAG77-5622 [uncultured Chloroflexota bacterium]